MCTVSVTLANNQEPSPYNKVGIPRKQMKMLLVKSIPINHVLIYLSWYKSHSTLQQHQELIKLQKYEYTLTQPKRSISSMWNIVTIV